MDGEEAAPPLTATPRFPSRFATANVCLIAIASSICVCECFFNIICSVLLAYNVLEQCPDGVCPDNHTGLIQKGFITMIIL